MFLRQTSYRQFHVRTHLAQQFVRMAHRTPEKVALVVGGNGALGKSVVETFKSNGFIVVSADRTTNESANVNVVFESDDLSAQVTAMSEALRQQPNARADAIVCTAGGWTGGSASSPELVGSLVSMSSMCLSPVFTTAAVAGGCLAEGGTVVLTGAAAALGPTPGMLAYGAVKAATHHMVVSLAAPGSGLPTGARVYGVLPRTIDTPSNRKWMAGGDTSTWTPPQDIAQQILAWCTQQGSAPASGSLMEVITAGGKSSWTAHTPLYAAQMS